MKEDVQDMLNVTWCNFMQQGIYKLQPVLQQCIYNMHCNTFLTYYHVFIYVVL